MTEHDARAIYPAPPRQSYPAQRSTDSRPNHYPMPQQFRQSVPRSSGWNKCSIAAIVCSFVSVAAPIGVLLGVVATYQCTKSQQRGRGLAIAAIVIGGAMTILLVLANTSAGPLP